MTNQGKLAMLVVCVAVAAGVTAPVAVALPNCQTVGQVSTCRTNGSVSIKVTPGRTAAPNQGIPWFITDPRINPNRR
jgi:predicted ThiF/HesA family dinucleotide-utilizing enzyme